MKSFLILTPEQFVKKTAIKSSQINFYSIQIHLSLISSNFFKSLCILFPLSSTTTGRNWHQGNSPRPQNLISPSRYSHVEESPATCTVAIPLDPICWLRSHHVEVEVWERSAQGCAPRKCTWGEHEPINGNLGVPSQCQPPPRNEVAFRGSP